MQVQISHAGRHLLQPAGADFIAQHRAAGPKDNHGQQSQSGIHPLTPVASQFILGSIGLRLLRRLPVLPPGSVDILGPVPTPHRAHGHFRGAAIEDHIPVHARRLLGQRLEYRRHDILRPLDQVLPHHPRHKGFAGCLPRTGPHRPQRCPQLGQRPHAEHDLHILQSRLRHRSLPADLVRLCQIHGRILLHELLRILVSHHAPHGKRSAGTAGQRSGQSRTYRGDPASQHCQPNLRQDGLSKGIDDPVGDEVGALDGIQCSLARLLQIDLNLHPVPLLRHPRLSRVDLLLSHHLVGQERLQQEPQHLPLGTVSGFTPCKLVEILETAPDCVARLEFRQPLVGLCQRAGLHCPCAPSHQAGRAAANGLHHLPPGLLLLPLGRGPGRQHGLRQSPLIRREGRHLIHQFLCAVPCTGAVPLCHQSSHHRLHGRLDLGHPCRHIGMDLPRRGFVISEPPSIIAWLRRRILLPRRPRISVWLSVQRRGRYHSGQAVQPAGAARLVLRHPVRSLQQKSLVLSPLSVMHQLGVERSLVIPHGHPFAARLISHPAIGILGHGLGISPTDGIPPLVHGRKIQPGLLCHQVHRGQSAPLSVRIGAGGLQVRINAVPDRRRLRPQPTVKIQDNVFGVLAHRSKIVASRFLRLTNPGSSLPPALV